MGYIVDITIANLIGFIAGTALTWSSPVLPDLENPKRTPFDYALTIEETSWISGMLPLGAILGPFIYAFLADSVGRKLALLICAVPFLLCFIAFALATVPWVFYVARFIIGMSVGGVFTTIPMYIGELAEDSNRGALGASMNCFICFGFLFSHAVGSYLSVFVFNLILTVPPVIFLVLFSVIAAESPHFYVIKQKDDKAKRALRRIRKGNDEAINKELMEMSEKIAETRKGNFLDIIKSRGLLKAFTISIGLLAFQQFSGINAVLFYAENIFHQAGSTLEPKICSIIVGSVQFLTSFSTPLVVERVGRRLLLIISSAGIIISEIPLGLYCHLQKRNYYVEDIGFIPVLCLIGYIIFFNTGLAILPWSMMGELFPDKVKFKASSLATAITWLLGFFIAKYFQPVAEEIGMGVCFWIFAGCTAMCIPFTLFYVIETKGKSLQEIQDILHG